MGFSSLHVCMDSSSDHWLQSTIQEDSAAVMDSSSSPSPISSAGDMNMIACSSKRPMTERKLRPPQDQIALKCPRCDSSHIKFCYYNNYSLSQPRYFCKSCRRYWTKGGTLRNIPVGGSCRKNKKVSSKKSNNDINNNQSLPINLSQAHHPLVVPSYLNHPKELLQLSNNNFPPDLQFPHGINNLLIGSTNAGTLMENPNFMENKYNMGMLEGMITSTSRNLDFFGMNGGDVGVGVGNEDHVLQSPNNYQGFCSSSAFGGMSLIDGNNLMESCNQRLMMLPYGSSSCDDEQNTSLIDVKPNPRVLSLEWQDMMHGGSDGKESFGCIGGAGSWNGVINGYGCSTTNPLV